MVRTSKGPAERSKAKATAARPTDADSKAFDRIADLDDATWGQIESMARSQNSTPADVIRRALTAQYGSPAPTGAINSGMSTDPKA